MLMTDLKSNKLIYLKAFLFLVILICSAGVIIAEIPDRKIAALLALAIWASARLYYFMFYVVGKYTDPGYRFSSIYSFIKYLFKRRKK